MTPTVGRIVHYKVGQTIADIINKRRRDFAEYRKTETYQDTGYMAHYGNQMQAGDILPLVIVKVWPTGPINGQVLLDGNDNIWVTSVTEGDEEGHWSWPPRV